MACDLPPRQCLEWHIKPKLTKARVSVDPDTGVVKGYKALCPAHNDRHHSFSIGVTDDGNLIRYQCFVCKNRRRERLGLIEKCGISEKCLPTPAKETRDLLDHLRLLVTAPTDNHAEVRLRIAAALEGYEGLPKGRELERIAGETSVSPRAAYSYRKREPPANPGKTSSYPP